MRKQRDSQMLQPQGRMIAFVALSEPFRARWNPCSVLLRQLVSALHGRQYHVRAALIRTKNPRTVLGNDRQVCKLIVDDKPEKSVQVHWFPGVSAGIEMPES